MILYCKNAANYCNIIQWFADFKFKKTYVRVNVCSVHGYYTQVHFSGCKTCQ